MTQQYLLFVLQINGNIHEIKHNVFFPRLILKIIFCEDFLPYNNGVGIFTTTTKITNQLHSLEFHFMLQEVSSIK